MNDDGFGMTSEQEINIYGIIDTEGKVVVKIQAIKNLKNLERLRKIAEEAVNADKSS